MNYKEAKEKAQEIHDKLTGYEFTKNKKARIIAVKHCDGSYLEFHSATFEKLDEEWTAVFTEHHGMFVYHFEDVKYIKERCHGGTHDMNPNNGEMFGVPYEDCVEEISDYQIVANAAGAGKKR